ncbi:MAG: FHA domain-containing protein [Bdellovibrionaceae bacterium]|nr:FHA domain-containing protein [Pseudobdellovibrionaceae bacterium]
MARLRTLFQGRFLQELQLSTDRSYIAGRKEDCDIVLLNEKSLSREHFKLSFDGSHWQLDVISRFGAVVYGGAEVQTLQLDSKMKFSLGAYEFEYSDIEASLVAGPRNSVPGLFVGAEGDGGESGDKTFINAANTIPYVKVVDASGDIKEMFKLEVGNQWVAGRDASCDIVIRDQRVSRRQFEIRRVGNQFVIMDLGSVNGTLLNGSPVSPIEPLPLKSSDAISVLDNHLYFELHDPEFKSRMEFVNASSPALVPTSHELIPQVNQYGQASSPMQHPGQFIPGLHLPGGANLEDIPRDKKFDFEKHRVKIIAGAIVLLVVAYFFSDQTSSPTPSNGPGIQTKSQEVFNKLPPEKQTLVKQTYQLSKNLYMQGKYELAKAEIAKIYEMVPEYEDSKDIERLANEALEIQAQKKRQEDLEKEKVEMEEKVQVKVSECKAQFNSDYTMSKLEDCLSSVLSLMPEHPAIMDLRQQVDLLVTNKQAKDAQKQEYQSQVQRLKNLFNKAEASFGESQYLRAQKEYQVVISSGLPDPNGLKSQARRQITSIQQTLKQKTSRFETEAEQAYKDQKLRDAIFALRKSAEIDPENEATKEKIDRYVLELRKQMMILYQEGVLEESYGNVEGGENRPGAKDKWKKIMDLDIPDGEYYAKAKIKLKKYGAL